MACFVSPIRIAALAFVAALSCTAGAKAVAADKPAEGNLATSIDTE